MKICRIFENQEIREEILIHSCFGVLNYSESPLASHVLGCLFIVSPLASHVLGCLIIVSPLASHVFALRESLTYPILNLPTIQTTIQLPRKMRYGVENLGM